MTPTRRLGKLRGRAAALLHQATSGATSSSASAGREQLVSELRDIVRQLGALKRTDILPRDAEREAHEAEHNEQGDVLDPTADREMEGLEDAMGGMAGGGATIPSMQGDASSALDGLEQKLLSLQSQLSASPRP